MANVKEKSRRVLEALEDFLQELKDAPGFVAVRSYETESNLFSTDQESVLAVQNTEIFATTSAAFTAEVNQRFTSALSSRVAAEDDLVMVPGGQILSLKQLTEELFEQSLARGTVLYLRDLRREKLDRWIEQRENQTAPPDESCLRPDWSWSGYVAVRRLDGKETLAEFVKLKKLLAEMQEG